MAVQIIINGENATESLLELSTLAAGLGQASEKVSNIKVNTTAEVKQKTAPKDKPVEVEPTNEDSATTTSSEEVEIKLEDLRALAKEKSTSDVKRSEVKATIAKFGGGGLPNVPKSDYRVLKQELEAL